VIAATGSGISGLTVTAWDAVSRAVSPVAGSRVAVTVPPGAAHPCSGTNLV